MVLFVFFLILIIIYLFIWIHETSNEAQFKLKVITSSFILYVCSGSDNSSDSGRFDSSRPAAPSERTRRSLHYIAPLR